MTKSVRILLAVFSICLCAASYAAPLTPSDAARLVRNKVSVAHLYPDKAECLIYSEAGTDGEYIEVEVIEVHDVRCGGDPGIRHRRASFKVNRITHSVLYFDAANDRHIPLDKVLRRRE